MPRLEELVAATPPAIRFLESYMNGARGYTRQDVRAGVNRLELLCRAFGEVEYPSALAEQHTAKIVQAAEEMLRRTKERLNGIARG